MDRLNQARLSTYILTNTDNDTTVIVHTLGLSANKRRVSLSNRSINLLEENEMKSTEADQQCWCLSKVGRSYSTECQPE